MLRTRLGAVAWGVATAAFVSISPVATHAATGVLEEVIVTARKRSESMQETPVAVSALTADALQAQNIRSMGDLTRVVPGLSAQDGSKFAAFAIRGVGSRNTKTVGIDPGVGVYVDGIFVPRTDSQLLDVVDAQSIQVLRGPQGTLFGKNTAGGALLLTTVKPGEEFGGEIATDVGNLDRLNLRGSVDVPLTDSLFSRFTLDSRTRDGYMDDAETGIDYGDEDKLAALAQFRWDVTEDFSASLMAMYSEQKENASPETCDLVNPSATLQGFAAPGDDRLGPEACNDSKALLDDDKVILDRTGVVWEMESTMLGLTLEWQLGDYSVKSLTGWLHQDNIHNWRDQDATPVFSIQNVTLLEEQLRANGIDPDEDREFISQEFQLNGFALDEKLEYTLGVFASQEEINNSLSGGLITDSGFLGQPVGDQFLALPPSLAGFRVAAVNSFDNKTWAAFAQGSYELADAWTLTLGARYSVEEKEIEQENYTSFTPAPAGLLTREEFDALQGTVHDVRPDPAIPYLQTDDDWDDFTPSATLSYTPLAEDVAGLGMDSLLVYGTWSQGFKAGGFSRLDLEFEAFDPENVTNYELGVKMDALDQSLRLNLALYYMEYEDMQIGVTRQLDDIRVGLSVANAGEATMRGGELEVSYLPTENWLFTASANYIDAEYDEFMDIARNPETGLFEPVDRSDEEFAYVPETTFSASAQYLIETDIGAFAARLAYSYKDEVFIGLTDGLREVDQAYLDSFDLWNARLSWRSPGEGNIQVALYVDNLTDEDYFGTGNIEFTAQGARVLVPGEERTYGVQVSYAF